MDAQCRIGFLAFIFGVCPEQTMRNPLPTTDLRRMEQGMAGVFLRLMDGIHIIRIRSLCDQARNGGRKRTTRTVEFTR